MMYDLLTDNQKTEQLIELFGDVFGPVRTHYANKSQIAFDCPQCSYDKGLQYDGKGNLEINYRKGKFNCWACGEETGMHGGIVKLFKKWADKDFLAAFYKLGIHFTYDVDGEEYVYVPQDNFKLPPEFSPLTNVPDIGLYKNYLQYLRNRGITPEMVEKFNIGCAFSGRYEARIILPSYNADNKLNYFVTRAISPKVKKLKYINAEVPKETIIYNEKFIDWSRPIFIVEGPFDHIVLPNSIPLLGKKMSDLLFETIYNNAESHIILVLDPDAWEKTKMLYNKLDGGKLMGRVFAVKMPSFVNSKGKVEGIDISKFNELHGQQGLFTYIQQNIIRLID